MYFYKHFKNIKIAFAVAAAVIMIQSSFAGAALAHYGEAITVVVKSVETIETEEPVYSQSDIDELARIIYWEARGEVIEGQLAVANVVINRLNSDDFPSTMKGVISQENQFTPYARADYYTVSVPDEYYAVAEIALAGDRVVDENVLWFRSDSKPDRWYKAVYTISIGGHHFYGL
ncbi:MAG: cell wall hydrolase [Christensenellales bacterium]